MSLNLSQLSKSLKRAAPNILTFVGAGCTVKAVIASSKAAIVAHEKLTNADHEMTTKEKIFAIAPAYIETGVYTLLGVGAPLAANAINSKRIAALSALVEVVTTAYTNEHDILKKVLSDKKYDREKAEVMEQCINSEEHRPEEVEYTGHGNQLFCDIFGRMFRSSVASVVAGLNDTNHIINAQDYASVNELYYRWNIRNSKVGDNIGWSQSSTGLIGFDPDRIGEVIMYHGEPCIYIDISMPSTKFN